MASSVRTVCLNALFLDPGRSGGPETYLRELAPALCREFPGVRLSVVTTRRGKRALSRDGWTDFAEVHALPADEGQRGRRTAAEQALLPAMAMRERWSMVHSLGSVAPIRVRGPSVITLHDVTFIRLRTFGRVTTFGMRQVVTRASRNADHLIAGSASARDEVCDALGLERSRFTVVPHGAGRLPAVPPTPEATVRSRYELDGARVVLCVAAKRPHKNQALLARAAEHLPEDMAIVLAGHPGPYEAEVQALAAQLGVERRVRSVDYVPDADLEALWRLAACAAFPTLAEGFGLPVLEAMQRGVPVACSDIPVLREVGARAARYFDPRDPRSAAAAIAAVAGDAELAAAGIDRAATFNWPEAARGTMEAYERAVAARCT